MTLNYRFVARGNKAADLYLYDDIGGDPFFGGGITSKQVVDDLAKLGPVSTLNVRINSVGGTVFEGVAIYNALARLPAKVVAHVDGLAASIASLIAMAGREIRIASNALIMIHDPRGVARGTADDMRHAADTLETVRGTMVTTYAKRTKQPEKMISDWMAAETWFTAEDAVSSGLADTVTEPLAIAASGDLSIFRNVPQHFLSRAKAPRPNADARAARFTEALRRVSQSATGPTQPQQ